jgi:hypothetical protein
VKPSGLLLLAFHLGHETVHQTEWLQQPISAHFVFFDSDEMTGYLRAAGFDVEEIVERDLYPEIERQSRRAYIFARPTDSQLLASR